MRGPWRAALALALHIGFFAVPIALVLGLFAIAALTFRYDHSGGLKAALAAVVVAAVFTVGLRAVLRTRLRTRGVALDREAQPQLWKAVDAIASATGAPLPDEIRITSEPSAGVREDTALLGLRTRARCLELGLPLLAALNLGELRAVVARELGALTGDRLPSVAHRVSTSIDRAVADLTGGPTKWLFAGYARAYRAVAGPTGRTLRLHADVVATQVTGRRAALSTLRKTRAIELGWREYADEYLSMAKAVGHTPDVLLGFRSFMDDQTRRPKLAERAKQEIAEEPATRERPSARERVEAMKRTKASERDIDERPAFAVLRNPRKSVPELEDGLMVDGLGPRLPWPELARLAGAAQVAEQAARLTAAVEQSGVQVEPVIGGVLQAVHHGQGAELINPALNPGLSPDRIDQAVEDTLTELLGGAVVDALVCARRAHHELDWAGPSVVRLGNGRPLDPDRLVRPAIADPRLVPGLHRALVDLGVPLNHARPPAEEPEPSLTGIVSPVRCAGRSYELVVTDRGLALLPSKASTAKRLLSGALARWRQAQLDELAELGATPVDELRARTGAQWVDNRDVAGAELTEQRGEWSLSLELYLDEYALSSLTGIDAPTGEDGIARLQLRSAADAMEHGDPYRGLGELMGARMAVRGASEG
ncbi:M48 family metallopeptidase [Saccharopolyspora rosea]|uniref:M48 family metallopeptidase n=1 Tax=Saccharopolyspora rosea TaxID=524884 RepID=A0ABW3FK42_9PSEU|nr:M48 family metallopeptidase [Saccharopolyspora rosea]